MLARGYFYLSRVEYSSTADARVLGFSTQLDYLRLYRSWVRFWDRYRCGLFMIL